MGVGGSVLLMVVLEPRLLPRSPRHVVFYFVLDSDDGGAVHTVRYGTEKRVRISIATDKVCWRGLNDR